MASKKSLLGGMTVKVEGMSGFDKSRFNAFTAPLGSIVPMVKQLMLPGKGKLSISLSAQLPPLATDAFLRSHLKCEAFFVPLRQCYGGFMSWFSGEQISADTSSSPLSSLTTAKLPRFHMNYTYTNPDTGVTVNASQILLNEVFGVHSLMDYFGVRFPLSSGNVDVLNYHARDYYNIFPAIAYQLCYHHWYRNKLIERPLFAPPDFTATPSTYVGSSLPYVSYSNIRDFDVNLSTASESMNSAIGLRSAYSVIRLLNGHLLELRQRNYGFDYFTTALPSAQDRSPMSVDTSGGSFTISALRLANASQHFAEVNQIAGPDYIATMRARYNRAPSSVVAQRPILLGSADFPMFTSGVEQNSQYVGSPNGNPFAGMAARYGRAHAEGSDFVCEFDVDEPGYLMVMCSLVPEANYSSGVSKDMTLFTEAGSIVDLPCSALERAGLEPIKSEEVYVDGASDTTTVFGYQPRYMWHKAGAVNEVHGLFRKGASLEAFIPQRDFSLSPQLDTDFLKVLPTDLDNVTAVSGAISQYGVMIDSSIKLFVVEPLGESVMPSLVDPGAEHGDSVYLKRGGISVND